MHLQNTRIRNSQVTRDFKEKRSATPTAEEKLTRSVLPTRTVGFGDLIILLEVSPALRTLGKQLCCQFEAGLLIFPASHSHFPISTSPIPRSFAVLGQTVTRCRTPHRCWFFPQRPLASSSEGHERQHRGQQNKRKLGNPSP